MTSISLNNLSIEHIRLLNQICKDVRNDFNQLVGQVFDQTDKSIDWLVSSTLSRDANLSPLFLNCCYVELLRQIIKQNSDIKCITVHSKELYKVITAWLFKEQKNIKVVCSENIRSKIKYYMRPWTGFVKSFFLFIFMSCAKSSKRAADLSTENPITLIDTFVLPETLKGDQFQDRYYPGLWEELSEKQKQNVYFLPHITAFASYPKQCRILDSVKGNFILKSDFLSVSDYWFALLRPFRIKRIHFAGFFLNGVDVAELFKSDFYFNLCNSSSFFGLLNYRFIASLKKKNVNIRLFVDWFENQVIDRGFIKAMKTFYPHVKTIGYQGYAAPEDFYIHIQPTSQEYKSGIIPDEIFVMGAKLADHIRHLVSDVKVSVAPAFRYQNVWRLSSKSVERKERVIFAPLPVRTQESCDILSFLLRIKQNPQFSTYKLYAKFHPASDYVRITKAFSKEQLKAVNFVESNTEQMLNKADIVISNSTSVCLESLTQGIPVIVIGSQSGLTQNPIPEAVKPDFWRLVYTEDELFQALKDLLDLSAEKREKFSQKAEEIKSDYFEPITNKKVMEFLVLN